MIKTFYNFIKTANQKPHCFEELEHLKQQMTKLQLVLIINKMSSCIGMDADIISIIAIFIIAIFSYIFWCEQSCLNFYFQVWIRFWILDFHCCLRLQLYIIQNGLERVTFFMLFPFNWHSCHGFVFKLDEFCSPNYCDINCVPAFTLQQACFSINNKFFSSRKMFIIAIFQEMSNIGTNINKEITHLDHTFFLMRSLLKTLEDLWRT